VTEDKLKTETLKPAREAEKSPGEPKIVDTRAQEEAAKDRKETGGYQ
jgi:hypothetical protein